ncbi:Antirestriction protein [Desulfosporosinus sp. I2]|uniref:antirestriction protein ArdA n=1 Tax=Desulfosporosinus sp. I2 TaxID=1617025 RepID=UPI0005F06EAA|nr:antirestriction protein ArdA [Desulfosporosinus sp. I2]KJR44996.1 Antirestriction protein [Desulfosporosinus sp. I2]
MWIELQAEHPSTQEISTKLCLPAMEKEIREAMKVINPYDRQDFHYLVTQCDLPILELEEYINCSSGNQYELDEINFLAERLTYLTDYQQEVMAYILKTGTASDMKNLINLTYHLDHFTLQGITNDEQLGSYCFTTGRIEVPDNLIEFIDLRKVGLQQRIQDKGQYLDHAYVVIGDYKLTEPYDGQTFPDVMQGAAIPIKVKLKPINSGDDGIWLRQPLTKREEELVCSKLGIKDIEDAQIADVSCLIQGFDREVLKEACLVELDTLAQTIQKIDQRDWLTLEAVIQYETQGVNPGSLHVSDYYNCGLNIQCYDHFPQVRTPAEYGCMRMEMAAANIPDMVQQFIDYNTLGAEKIAAEKGRFTDYGYICRNANEYLDVCEGVEILQQQL